ncbi:MAG: hypothetical protein KJ645_06190, partial [Planctomycetes bacterium]|nr:hypothetical protein [Planctomycetota bacterium]
MQLRFALIILGCIITSGRGFAEGEEKPGRLEPAYLERSEKIEDGDINARVELCRWCRDRGYLREMISETRLVLEKDADHPAVMDLLYRESDGKDWHYTLPGLETLKTPFDADKDPGALRKRLLEKSIDKKFELDKKSFRFNFSTDLEKDRMQDYILVLNRHYDQLKGFFKITKTEVGIDVVIFSKRSDYGQFHILTTGSGGEHTGGFFRYAGGNSLLCFYDDPYDDDQVFTVAKHECTHLLVLHCMLGGHPGLWLNEGLACYFAGEGLERSDAYTARCLFAVKRAVETGGAISLKALMETPQEKFGFNHYATAWSWVYYLQSGSETRSDFSRMMLELKKQAQTSENHEKLEALSDQLFIERFGSPEELQPGWESFVKSLENETPLQNYFSAKNAFRYAGRWLECDPPLTDTERDDLLKAGEDRLQQAAESGIAGLQDLCEVQKGMALLARAVTKEYTLKEKLYCAVATAKIVDRFLLDSKNHSLAHSMGKVVYEALAILKRSGEYESTGDRFFGFQEAIVRAEKGVKDLLVTLNPTASKKKSVSEDLKLLEFQRLAVERLTALGQYAFQAALEHDPTNSLAAEDW